VSQSGTGDDKADAFGSLDEICQLLQAHPAFREFPVTRVATKSRTGVLAGQILKNLRLLRFGAEFARCLTLLHFQIHQDQPRVLAVDLQWHLKRIRNDWSVFIHFLDGSGEIRFQGDYALRGTVPDLLGFVSARRLVVVPAAVPPGTYRIRLGVWLPGAACHLKLTRFRGCRRDPAAWYGNAVALGNVNI